jgi:hypothetical protein
MRHTPGRLLAAALLAASPAFLGPVAASETDPCAFFRGQAYGKGLLHYSTEMLWACEEIAARRTAGVALSPRLEDAEVALEAYRSAIMAAAEDGFRAARVSGTEAMVIGTREESKRALAASTGSLAALEAIRTGF